MCNEKYDFVAITYIDTIHFRKLLKIKLMNLIFKILENNIHIIQHKTVISLNKHIISIHNSIIRKLYLPGEK